MKILDFLKGKENIDKLIEKLQNSDEDKRNEALKKLSEMQLELTEGMKLLEASKKQFPKCKFDWQDISSDLINICGKNPYNEYILKIESIYDDLNPNAKITALNFLARYENEQALIGYLKLLEKDYDKLMSLPVGNLNRNPVNVDILFPRLLKFAVNKDIAVDIYMILLNCFDSGIIKEAQIKESKAMIINDVVDMASKVLNYKFDEDNKCLWNDDEYLELRYAAGVYFDLAGYINSAEVTLTLRNLMKIKDIKLKLFAAISLIKLGETISEEDAMKIAADSESRNWFYDNLKRVGKVELFPEEYKNQKAFAESNMVDWLIYPTELGRVPDAIELMNVFDTEEEEYYLFRFKCDSVEASKEDGWMAGVSGPFSKNEMPTTLAGGYTFSHFEKWESKTPEEHLNSIVDNISKYWMKRAEELEN